MKSFLVKEVGEEEEEGILENERGEKIDEQDSLEYQRKLFQSLARHEAQDNASEVSSLGVGNLQDFSIKRNKKDVNIYPPRSTTTPVSCVNDHLDGDNDDDEDELLEKVFQEGRNASIGKIGGTVRGDIDSKSKGLLNKQLLSLKERNLKTHLGKKMYQYFQRNCSQAQQNSIFSSKSTTTIYQYLLNEPSNDSELFLGHDSSSFMSAKKSNVKSSFMTIHQSKNQDVSSGSKKTQAIKSVTKDERDDLLNVIPNIITKGGRTSLIPNNNEGTTPSGNEKSNDGDESYSPSLPNPLFDRLEIVMKDFRENSSSDIQIHIHRNFDRHKIMQNRKINSNEKTIDHNSNQISNNVHDNGGGNDDDDDDDIFEGVGSDYVCKVENNKKEEITMVNDNQKVDHDDDDDDDDMDSFPVTGPYVSNGEEDLEQPVNKIAPNEEDNEINEKDNEREDIDDETKKLKKQLEDAIKKQEELKQKFIGSSKTNDRKSGYDMLFRRNDYVGKFDFERREKLNLEELVHREREQMDECDTEGVISNQSIEESFQDLKSMRNQSFNTQGRKQQQQHKSGKGDDEKTDSHAVGDDHNDPRIKKKPPKKQGKSLTQELKQITDIIKRKKTESGSETENSARKKRKKQSGSGVAGGNMEQIFS